jgi:solute carrier family 66, member 2
MLFTLALTTLQILIAPSPANAFGYTTLLGTLGLTIEALLPLPQLHSNWQAQSCKGFRVSVLVNWLVGDVLKLGFFFMSDAGKVPWAFKLCATFQALCDVGLGLQYYLYGERPEVERDIRLS